MRKALLPLLACLLICGAATAALIATTAHADQTKRPPAMVLAQNQPSPNRDRAPGPPPDMDGPMMQGGGQLCRDIYARRAGELAFMDDHQGNGGLKAALRMARLFGCHFE